MIARSNQKKARGAKITENRHNRPVQSVLGKRQASLYSDEVKHRRFDSDSSNQSRSSLNGKEQEERKQRVAEAIEKLKRASVKRPITIDIKRRGPARKIAKTGLSKQEEARLERKRSAVDIRRLGPAKKYMKEDLEEQKEREAKVRFANLLNKARKQREISTKRRRVQNKYGV